MSPSSRRRLGLLIAAVVFVAVGGVSAWRMVHAHGEGWTGMSYMPRQAKPAPMASPLGWVPGSVILVFPASPADRAGIKPGDMVESFNGIPITDWPRLQTLDRRTKRGDRIVVRIVRNGVARDVPIALESELRSPLIGTGMISSLIVGLVYLVIGAVIFFRRPEDRRVTIFFALTLIAYSSFVGSPLLQTVNMHGIAPPENFSFLPQMLVVIVAALLFAPTLLHLALIFPKPRPIVARRPEIFRWIYAPVLLVLPAAAWLTFSVGALAAKKHTTAGFKLALVCALLGAALIATGAIRVALRARREGFRDAVLRQPVWSSITGLGLFAGLTIALQRGGSHVTALMAGLAVAAIVCVGFATYPVATLIALYRSYRDSGVEEKRQVQWPLWATIVAVGVKVIVSGFTLVFNTANLFQQKPFLAVGVLQTLDLIPKLLYILIPLSFAFAIVKYRLMDIDLIIRRTVTYAMLSVAVFVVYGVLIAGVGAMLVHLAGVRNQAVLVGSTIVVALLAVPLRNTLQRLVDRNVFRERVSYPLALRTLADAVGGGATREELLRLLAEQLQQALQNRMVLVAMRSDQHFVATAKVGVADEVLGSFRVAAAGVALTRPLDPERDALPPELAQRLRRLGAKLVVPMRAQRDAIGFVALGAKLSNEPFSAEDLEFIQSAATQAAMALETSRLRTEEVDFEQARAMQLVLLPKALPTLDGIAISGMWQPARSVGGDYYDAIALGDGKAGVCIADVAGKGMAAALLMASLQAAVKATAAADTAPSRLCEKVRNVVAGNLAGGTFITFFYALLDARARTLTYCNAGHNPPLLVRAGGEVVRLHAGGSVLGRLFRDDAYDEAAVALASGDRIVLFTDGVSEARREGGEDFGDERLIDVVRANRERPPAELQDAIVEAVTAFTSGSFHDDVTMVVIGVV